MVTTQRGAAWPPFLLRFIPRTRLLFLCHVTYTLYLLQPVLQAVGWLANVLAYIVYSLPAARAQQPAELALPLLLHLHAIAAI
jgi:hypothetical protein